jgi:type IV pilus assembly protein PilN
MIRINLLPARVSKKKETAKQQIAILVLTLIIIAGVVLSVFSVTLAKISSTKNEISESEKELQKLKEKIGEIDNIKKLQAEVKKKLDILANLRMEKLGPANRLAKLSDSVPDKLWLTKYSESGDRLSISGIAFNEELIAEFIRKLTETKEFSNVELLVSEQVDFSGVKAKRFDLTAVLRGKP